MPTYNVNHVDIEAVAKAIALRQHRAVHGCAARNDDARSLFLREKEKSHFFLFVCRKVQDGLLRHSLEKRRAARMQGWNGTVI